MIYLFNQTEELIDVIDEASLAEFTHTVELNQFDRASFEIPVDYKPEIIKEAQFFGFQSRDRAFCLFRISEKSYDLGLTIQGIDRAESDLHSFIIEDKRPGGTASDVLREILEGTGYQLGNVDGLTRTGRLSFYYISVRQALVKIIESYACEFKIRYTFVENKIIGRYIDLNQRFGRVTGHQFEYGSNILNVTYEESSDDVVTALIGRGKGEEKTNESGEATGGYGRRIQFKDVSWSVSKGDPVDKPAGQNYVTNEAARNIYGLHQNGVIKHRFGVYTNEDIEDPVELLKATYKELQRLSVPIVTFKANLLDLANAIEQDVWIGDSVGIVRDQIGIAFGARIHKLTIDKLDDNRSVAELGDYQTLQAKDRSTRQQAIKDALGGFSESLIEEAIAHEVERRDKEFDEMIRVKTLEFDNSIQLAKEKSEEFKQQISSEIDKKFQSFDNASIQEARRKAEEALRSAGASSSLAQEAKTIADQASAKMNQFKQESSKAQRDLSENVNRFKSELQQSLAGKADNVTVEQTERALRQKFESLSTDTLVKINAAKTEFEKTAQGLSTKITNVETYVNSDGQRQDDLKRYVREESASQARAVREDVTRDFVGKNTFQENIQGVERRLESFSLGTSGNLLKNSNVGFYNQHDKKYRLVETLQANQTYTLVTKYWHGENATGHTFLDGIGNWRRLTYNSAIDAWMLQFTPSKEIPAGTEVILSSDPYNSLGNMDWATLVRGAIPLIHWQPAKGDVEEGVTQKLAEYKETVDGRFATISRQINNKANQSDFQRVKETSQLYERILGNTENGIADKVARMALTNQLFQVEVGKATRGGRNYIKNGRFKNGSKHWIEHQSVNFGLNFNYQHSSDNRNRTGLHIYHEAQDVADYFGVQQMFSFDGYRGEQVSLSLLASKDGGAPSSLKVVLHYIKNDIIVGQEWKDIPNGNIPWKKYKRFTFSYSLWDDVDSIRLMLYGERAKDINLYITDVQFERGTVATDYKEAPEDTEEAIRSVQSQLDGSWSVQNINSAGDIISGINLGATGHNRITGKLTHITGETLIDNAVIKSAMIDKLKTANFESGSVTTKILDAEAVTADKVKMNEAFANKLVASDTFTNTLTAKRGFINQLVSNNIFTDGLTAQRGFIQKLVSNDIFTNDLAAKRGFINQLQSKIINTETLDAFRGRIGGFNLGPFPQGGGRWIAGNNPYICGMGNGEGGGVRTAFWANWGSNWNQAGWGSWVVTTDGKMSCKNDVSFYHRTDFSNTCTVNFFSQPTFSKGAVINGDLQVSGRITYSGGEWLYSPRYKQLRKSTEQGSDWLYLDIQGNYGSDWIHMNKVISDRRYKSNIQDSQVSGLDVIEKLKTYSYRKEYDGKIEDISCGIMAQDVQKYAPEAFYKNPDGAYTYETFALVPYLIKAIQELNQKINLMEERYGSII